MKVYTYHAGTDENVAALQMALLIVTRQILEQFTVIAKGNVVCTPSGVPHPTEDWLEGVMADPAAVQDSQLRSQSPETLRRQLSSITTSKDLQQLSAPVKHLIILYHILDHTFDHITDHILDHINIYSIIYLVVQFVIYFTIYTCLYL